MFKKSGVAPIALVCSLVLVFAAASFAERGVRPTPRFSSNQPSEVSRIAAPCEDADIAKAVVEQIRKGFTAAELETFRTLHNFHVGVTCKRKVVTLVGWVAGKTLFDRVVTLAKHTDCVKSLNTKKLFKHHVGGCGRGEADCCGDGQICVTKLSACPLCVL